MPPQDRNRHKICQCRPDCQRLLGLDQRRNHYQLVNDPFTICRSMTPPEQELSDSTELTNRSMEGIAVDEHEILDNDDIGMGLPIPYGLEDASSAFGDDNNLRGEGLDFADAGQEAGDGFFDESDLESSEDDSNEFDEPLLSLEEMREAIQDEIGPGIDLEMWELRMPSCSSIISFIIINAAYQATHLSLTRIASMHEHSS